MALTQKQRVWKARAQKAAVTRKINIMAGKAKRDQDNKRAILDFQKTRPGDLPNRPGRPDRAAREILGNMAAFGLSLRQIARLTGYTGAELKEWFPDEIANAALRTDLKVFRTLVQQATGDGDWRQADGRSTRFYAERRLGMTPPTAKRYGEDRRINLDNLSEGERDDLELLLERAIGGDREAQVLAGELSIAGGGGEVAEDAGAPEADEGGSQPGPVDLGDGGPEGQSAQDLRGEPD
jgi:hypothetical protein